MAKLRLGIGAKVWVLVSRLHPKDVISKAYPNYTKAHKAEGLVAASEGPKPICHEEKVVVVFRHPPRTEFRQPLQVQSHLEMPRILVQLGHIQRT